jgi:hypothetical protein
MNDENFSGPAPAWQLWRNPILRRFLRTRLRPRPLGASLLIVLLMTGFIFTIARTIGKSQIEYHRSVAQEAIAEGRPVPGGLTLTMESVERMSLLPLLAVQGFLLFVIGTGQVAGGMTADADEGTMDYMRLSPMTPLAKVLGYLFGLPVREWLLFAATLPLTAWGIWKGAVPWENWVPVYAVLLTAAVLYHLTGLTAGTVLRNRRWAFLVSMGGVFLLYTVIPQLANLGLVYFEYLTIMPVVMENLPGFLPQSAGMALRMVRELEPDVRFFGLGLPEAVFTVFSQLVLCFTFGFMLWRRWRRSESHLLGKVWATGLAGWIQVVLLGCALPLISPGLLFFSRRFMSQFGGRVGRLTPWEPSLSEAAAMIALYGTVTMLAVVLLAVMVSPSRETQKTGLRRALRITAGKVPFFSDEAGALPFAVVMALAGAAGWWVFAQRITGSHWFPGVELPGWTPLAFASVMLTASLLSVLLYELRGTKGLFLAMVFGGVVPLLAGAVMVAAGRDVSAASVWVISLSPLVAPANAVAAALPAADFDVSDAGAMRLAGPRAFVFWQGVMLLAVFWLWVRHRVERRAGRAEAMVLAPGPD